MSKSFQFSLIIKGTILATILAMLLSLVFGALLSFTSIPESDLSINIIFGFSVFIAAFITAYQGGTRGLYYGLSVGIGFIILVLIVSGILWSDTPSWLKLAEKTIIALLAGGTGGIIGVLFPQS
ncbi:putative membrane protein, TIGR04086 family/integral membrane protein, TIGR04097 family [Desulfosporosinus orientis DSM 765]|uniref:Putative membrane protein, TIGR04086 family/integral membrane protein, TIGR04097 family n=1 Tax=Desulfosporosinus orientis (strain ATCC 19365 / DSM 765 / NCIMB 8382 / VKM B-1628 / Singapore I) TaxID=768706 RepID=G7WDU3_DESOD|nr:TIGR04086 family membrane protein [Desulfosporosinus orientis]AET68850.1 putative membrane protein, TIGR04086 family/integral membrane protein, TIGR04097 family [Desulfosporosinus orientis DSM 765]